METNSSEFCPLVYGEGDTYLVQHLLSDEIASDAFERVKEEVQWKTMYHHGESSRYT